MLTHVAEMQFYFMVEFAKYVKNTYICYQYIPGSTSSQTHIVDVQKHIVKAAFEIDAVMVEGGIIWEFPSHLVLQMCFQLCIPLLSGCHW